MTTRIIGTGSAVPKQVVTNDDLAKIVDTSDEWIRPRTGIRERRIAAAESGTSDLAAEAAKLVAESGSRHAAAISSHPCAALYGLECVSDKIQDSENNYTRFFCVAKDPVIYAGANRISLILSFENKPGALYEILSKLAALDINMTKLESCPVAGSDFEFVFFLELEASVQDPSVLAMLEEMERSCAEFVFLGNYAEV